jgi:hypothetical protein
MSQDVTAADFTRQPDWRWQRALSLSKRKERCGRKCDNWIVRAVQFLQSTAGGKELATSPPNQVAIAESLRLFQESPSQRRRELQARLLTDAPLDEVARQIALPEDTVQAFEALFFAVRDHRTAHDWIASKVLKSFLAPTSREEAIGRTWMFFAHSGGLAALEIVLSATTNRPLPQWILDRLGPDTELASKRLICSARLAVAANLAQSPRELATLAGIAEQMRQTKPGPTSSSDSHDAKLLRVMARFDRILGNSGTAPRRTPRSRRRTVPKRVLTDGTKREVLDAYADMFR